MRTAFGHNPIHSKRENEKIVCQRETQLNILFVFLPKKGCRKNLNNLLYKKHFKNQPENTYDTYARSR